MKHVILITALFMVTALAPAKEVKTGALTLNVPDTWVQEKVRSAMRAAQFIVPGPDAKQEEVGELVIFYFGPQQGGTVDANIQRWVGQFVEKGRDVKKDQGDSVNGQYNLVNITGTYNKPFGPPICPPEHTDSWLSDVSHYREYAQRKLLSEIDRPSQNGHRSRRGHEKGNRYKVSVNLSCLASIILPA